MTSEASSIIQAVNVTKTFAQSALPVQAVRGIDLTIHKGEMVSIVGPSGSGKSTLLTLLGAIDAPTSGQVILEGTDCATLDDAQRTMLRRRRIGFVFQAFNLLPTLTAVENVALPLELDGVAEAEAVQRAADALAGVGLEKRRDHLPSMLSGGEQQRVAIARALVIDPALVMADEPTGNLDSVSSRQVTDLLRQLVDEQQQTVVMVTHDMEVANRADRIVHVRDGQIDPQPFHSVSGGDPTTEAQ
ncbi:ABC transporter ATP-binding protein [Roseimaritima ulvae]|uniref:Lipoprotein-releasing system ATP-binding protein LolD n=1 Tax=Roseimaritima ulvae TaxID=980254 RepID=A0A5B9QPI2_9BACT|nr:ABC transporter ATP-binding protein [Roseimaritima ulvae]QEG39580.1 Lipoprotein-releasing system ATP-binding protein LolD [Roseimaritima ulvae]